MLLKSDFPHVLKIAIMPIQNYSAAHLGVGMFHRNNQCSTEFEVTNGFNGSYHRLGSDQCWGHVPG